MSKEHCETCQFWTPNDTERRKGWGYCGLMDSESSNPIEETTLAVAIDHEGYAAGVKTRSDFGCVMWVKEEAT